VVSKVFERFKAAGLVYQVEGDTQGYLPARSLDMITLDAIVDAVEGYLDDHFVAVSSDMPELTELFQDIQQTQAETLKKAKVSSFLQ